MGTKGAGNPLDGAALFHKGTLCVQVIHVFRPIFNGRIAQVGIFRNIQLHAARVQVGNVVFWCGAAFDKMQVCLLTENNKRVLKLAGSWCIQAEIRLERDGHLDMRRNIYERTARPDGSVQRNKFVIRRRHKLHEMLLYHWPVHWITHSAFHIRVDDTLTAHLLTDIMIHNF